MIVAIAAIALTGCGSQKNSAAGELPATLVPNIAQGAEAYFSPDGESLIFNAKLDGDTLFQTYTIHHSPWKWLRIYL